MIVIALVLTDGGRVWVVPGGHVVTILSIGTRIQENGQCQRRSVAVNKDLWRRSGRSCYDWQAKSGRCWVRLNCNGSFKGWCTTLNRWPFCVMSAPSWFVLLVAVNCQNCFSSARGTPDILSWIFAPKGKSPNFWPTNLFNHNFGKQSLNGMYYCSNLVKPIHKSPHVYYANILNKLALKGIRTALQ